MPQERTRKTARLANELKRDLKRIRRYYKESVQEKAGENGQRSAWLRDNFHILAREGLATIRELRHAPKLPEEGVYPRIYLLCRSLCPQGKLPDMQTIAAALAPKHLTVEEVQLLGLMLRAALLKSALESLEDGERTVEWPVTSLRRLADIDFEELTVEICETEKLLRRDPSGIYPGMDVQTRANYRKQVAVLAQKQKSSESKIAQAALKAAQTADDDRGRHIGAQLFYSGDAQAKRRARGVLCLAAQGILPAIAALLIGIALKNWYAGMLLYLPLWEILRYPIEAVAMRRIAPSPLPRIEMKEIPASAGTLVAVSSLLPRAADAPAVAGHLEELYRANKQGEIRFLLLADYRAAKTPSVPGDEADLNAMRGEIDRLNQKYSGGFLLAVRDRVYSPSQGDYSGYERKRGAITQLVRVIKRGQEETFHIYGDCTNLAQTRYLLLLDADTGLPFNTALDLVSAAVHPLNQPVIDIERGRVVDGYGILTTGIETSIHSAGRTRFSRIMAGTGGITAYDCAASNFYQDLFGEGIFAGKGLLDVDAFYTLMTDAIEDATVLSHDILEGGFLRAGFLCDAQMTDAFPSREGAYLDRLHRWVRGDWQNIIWLICKHPAGKNRENPLSSLSKYKLFDNLRRSLTPVLALACVIAAPLVVGAAGFVLLAGAFWSACAGELYACVRAAVSGGVGMFSRRYYSKTMPAALAAAARGGVNLLMLVQTGWVCLDAICRALWRTLVSRKNMLEWTTAADSDAGQKTGKLLRRYAPSLLVGLALVISLHPVYMAAGAAIAANLLFAIWSGESGAVPQTRRLDWMRRDYIATQAAAQWRYYTEFCTVAENYLPPDNVQETPVAGIAHRTSPTNIGMLLLCTLAARDFGFLTSGELYTRLDQTLTSVEKLEKYRGNLLNWYDTMTLRPMEPYYVSAVDSGNFLCCITALRQGVLEYMGEEPALAQIAQRIQRLLEDCDLTFLYNHKRRLFHIGYDLVKQELTPSCYDLLMSEARMTSYYAVAKRMVPKKHWGALGRTLAREGAYAGPVSWTGTMFEYFMPHILLPAYENTLLSEALRFCLRCQRQRVRERGIPWGISESGFYAFDGELNYKYKAHGVQKLALKRGMNRDLVISPYSTFLSLPFDLPAGYANLKKLEELELVGRCGFYEAADFTVQRMEGQEYAVVRSYMAHHVGMSMLASVNALKENIMQKRFMRDSDMAAARSLLEEKIEQGAVVFDDVRTNDTPARAPRAEDKARDIYQIDAASPAMGILTNGEWSVALTDSGAGISLYRSANITVSSGDLLRRPAGVFAFLQAKGAEFPINKAIARDQDVQYEAQFTRNSITLSGEKNAVSAAMSTCVHPRLPCEIRRFTVKNKRPAALEAQLRIYLEPSLAAQRDEQAHPAFSKLFLTVDYDAANRVLVYTRRARGSEQQMCLAAGFCGKVDFQYETAREKALTRPEGIFSLGRSEMAFTGTQGVKDVCAAFCIPLQVAARGAKEVTLLLAAAATPQEAVARLVRARADMGGKGMKGAPSPFYTGSIDGVLAAKILPRLFYPVAETREYLASAQENTAGQAALWELGISGDFPILYTHAAGGTDMSALAEYLKVHRKLGRCGIRTDLAIVYQSAAVQSFEQVREEVYEMLRAEHCVDSLGKRAGIHLIDGGAHSARVLCCLEAVARYIAPPSGVERLEMPTYAYRPVEILPCAAREKKEGGTNSAFPVEGGEFFDDCFTVKQPPAVPWCHVLANTEFGTLVSDSALGCTWAVNSRENKLTPWYNDTRTDNRGEMALLRLHDKVYDLVLGARAVFSPAYARYAGMAGGLKTTVTVSVPGKGMIKYMDVQVENPATHPVEIQLAYYTEPVLDVTRETARLIQSKTVEGGILLKNPFNTAVRGVTLVGVTGEPDFFCCDRVRFLSGEWDYARHLPQPDPCAAVGKNLLLEPGASVCVRFYLAFAREERACIQLPRLPLPANRGGAGLTVKTPDEQLNAMVNTWLPHQIIACRMYARMGFYQSGGAWGLRDQLQDAGAVIMTHPALVRRQLLRAASNQFEAGDALHWWHFLPKAGGGLRGVRTRYSDDYVWIAFELARYFQMTGDAAFLNVKAPYIQGDVLTPEEKERYFAPALAPVRETLYQHAARALDRALAQLGAHGLPLIGGGDWNDGYNLVGAGGRGESVWLAQFLSLTLDMFCNVCAAMDDVQRMRAYREAARQLRVNVDTHAFETDRYLRAFYDDGGKMGATDSRECTIDSLTQSFAVLCGMENTKRVEAALDSAVRHLVDREKRIIRLFAPPFTGEGRNPGYVSRYPQGIRENGGQYTHAAVWLCMALIRFGRVDEGYTLLRMINPAVITRDAHAAQQYQTEPYALAGDVSNSPRAPGRGGWTHYTGSAGWYYVTAVEELLGLRLRNGNLTILPNLPRDWDGYTAQYEFGGAPVQITVSRASRPGMYVDGQPAQALKPDGKPHKIEVGL